MAGFDQSPDYHAFLLRCWQERSRHATQPTVWRFSLEDPHTGTRRGFGSLEAVLGALRQALDADAARPLSDPVAANHLKEADQA